MAVHFIRTVPWKAPLLLIWLLWGRARLKSRLAEYWAPNPATLPINEDVLEYLRKEHRGGRQLVLATASPERVARSIADQLSIFSLVLATSETVNLKGSRKAAAILSMAEKLQYAGNSSSDFGIWRQSAGAVLAGCAPVFCRTPEERRHSDSGHLPTFSKKTLADSWGASMGEERANFSAHCDITPVLRTRPPRDRTYGLCSVLSNGICRLHCE
jgi:hypothetical protein